MLNQREADRLMDEWIKGIKKYWDKRFSIKDKDDFLKTGYNSNEFRTVHLLPQLMVGQNIEYWDDDPRGLQIGTITEIKKCRFKDSKTYKSNISDVCSLCPGYIGIDYGKCKCRISAPYTYIRRIVTFSFIEKDEFKL